MNIVAPFGFYGYGNIGDEATLQGFARLVGARHDRIRAWVASQNPQHTARVEPSFRYYRYQHGWRRYWTTWIRQLAGAYVFPGGTPIMDGLGDWPLCEVAALLQHARRLGKPVVFVGAGTEHLHRAESRRIVAETIADYVAHWSVRSSRDRDRLLALGVPPDRITVAADMAWLLPQVTAEFGRRTLHQHGIAAHRLVAVNVNGEAALMEREPRLFEKLAFVLDRLVEEHAASVLFVCNEVREDAAFDKAAAAAVKGLMRRKDAAFDLPNAYWKPQEMMSIVAACDLAISTRYHSCLFAARQGVPFLAIKRSDKVSDLCEDLDWPFGAVPGSMDVAQLVSQAAALLEGPSQPLARLSARVQAMTERAQRNQAALDALRKCVGPASRFKALRAALPKRAAVSS
jgi:polysaccharide pyruvyl transferase WcaK-like protein